MIKAYYLLTKPGIVYSNALTAAGGFFLAAKGQINILLFISLLLGLSLVIASACVVNNYIDRGIDSKMSRTKKRPLVTKEISESKAIIFGALLGIAGFSLLYFFTNPLAAFIGFIGYFFYLVVYGFGKRISVHGTLIGSISGAVPPVAGYCAVTDHVDLAAFLLFFTLVFWQMPHFYAIAIFRKDDYQSASIPVLPIKKGISHTKKQMFWYVVTFIICVSSLTFFRYTGYVFLTMLLIVGVWWLRIVHKGFSESDNIVWAKKVFFFSLTVILVFSLALAINSFFP